MAEGTSTQKSLPKCRRCWHELVPGALVCEQCHALVHGEQLERVAAEAKILEGNGKLRQARELWLRTLPLLPPASTQAAWIQHHAADLEDDSALMPPDAENNWATRVGTLRPLFVSLLAFVAVSWSLYGFRFGIGFAFLVLIHEMGHYVDVKRRGLPADMPVFLPGLGAYVRWHALGVSTETRAAVSLAGPFAGWLSAAACALLWSLTGDGLWASLARTGAWLNILNLVPIWPLDGGQAASALSKFERGVLLTVSVAISFFVKEPIFLLIAAGASYRLFTHDAPPHPSRQTAAYFASTLALLALVLAFTPGHGFGFP